MEIVHPKAYLNTLAFEPVAEAHRLSQLTPHQRVLELDRQVKSHENHVRRDKAVSILYNYWVDGEGDVYSSPGRREIDNVKNQIDFRERNGLFYEGILMAADMAQKNPNELILLYSPTGKKLFDGTKVGNVDEEELEFLKKPYDLGQLYFMYYDGEKINNVAVSTGNDHNYWLRELLSAADEINSIGNEESKIQAFLTNPQSIGPVDSFFQKRWTHNHLIFENVHGEKFYLDQVLKSMKMTFADNSRLEITLDPETILAMQKETITPIDVARAYLMPAYQQAYLSYRRDDTGKIVFGGGCGGTQTTKSELEELLGIWRPTSSASTEFRSKRQYNNDEDSDQYGSLEFNCPVCRGHHRRTKGKLMEYCPDTVDENGLHVPIPKC